MAETCKSSQLSSIVSPFTTLEGEDNSADRSAVIDVSRKADAVEEDDFFRELVKKTAAGEKIEDNIIIQKNHIKIYCSAVKHICGRFCNRELVRH